ncbi:YceI family protein [uncultured Paracoccus sp.]|uniref:YceI family protein n=1 Tax=uncultured Paracoccus sp. TaxID=189685 RepID=UPI00262A95D6|nr:YceI family protein [uncultured Paracoccus sp.]
MKTPIAPLLALTLALVPALARAEATTTVDPAAITPADVPRGQPDYHAAGAGAYVLDPAHTAVIARVPHMNFSVSVFRFDTVSGSLQWNPENSAASTLTATVQAGSISNPYPGFAETLTGADYLNVAAHPEASFTATGFDAVSNTAGTVTGDLTIMGQTHPATFDVTLIGAGEGYTGDENDLPILAHLIGMHAETTIDPQAYGLNAFFTDPIEIQIDAEFARKPAPKS